MNDFLIKEYRHYHQQGDLAEAKKILLIAAKNEPSDAWLRREIGMISYWMNEWSEALEALEAALKLDESMKFVHYTKGHVFRFMNQLEDSILSYENEIQINEGFGPASYYAAYSLYKLGRFGEAREFLTKARTDKSLWQSAADGRVPLTKKITHRPTQEPDYFRLADFIARNYGLTGILLHGFGVSTLAQLLLRKSISVNCLAYDPNEAVRGDLIAPHRFVCSLPDTIPYENNSFQTAVCIGSFDALSPSESNLVMDEFFRLGVKNIVVIGARQRETGVWQEVLNSDLYSISPHHLQVNLHHHKDLSTFVLKPADAARVAVANDLREANENWHDPLYGLKEDSLSSAEEFAALARFFKDYAPHASKILCENSIKNEAVVFSELLPARITVQGSQLVDQLEKLHLPFKRNLSFTSDSEVESWDGFVNVNYCDGWDAVAEYVEKISMKWSENDVRNFLLLGVNIESEACQDANLIECVERIFDLYNDRANSHLVLQRFGVVVNTTSGQSRLIGDDVSEFEQLEHILVAHAQTGIITKVLFLFGKSACVSTLAKLPPHEFRETYERPNNRPPLTVGQKISLANIIEDSSDFGNGGAGAYFKAVVARLAAGYAILAQPNCQQPLTASVLDKVSKLDHEGENVSRSPELTRWIMSLRRLGAQLCLKLGDFEGAARWFEGCIHPDYEEVIPHLLRHVLDARLFLGCLSLAKNDHTLALRHWTAGVEEFKRMVPRLPEHTFEQEFQYNECANLFVVGRLLLDSRKRLEGGQISPWKFPHDIQLAVAALPRPVDRYEDRRASGEMKFKVYS